ncbi:MAG: hypothetical protein KIS78_16155 [Labilithrix sp.]|nr:hypothetical protein [Labilithrix sp.]
MIARIGFAAMRGESHFSQRERFVRVSFWPLSFACFDVASEPLVGRLVRRDVDVGASPHARRDRASALVRPAARVTHAAPRRIGPRGGARGEAPHCIGREREPFARVTRTSHVFAVVFQRTDPLAGRASLTPSRQRR